MLSRIFSCTFVIAVAWCAVGYPAVHPSPDFALPPSSAAYEAQSLPPFPSVNLQPDFDMEAVRDGAYAIADQYEPERYFVDDLIEKLDYDPGAAFHFVRDEIRFDPYRGILRGAEGVLGGQAGNAYDRSLLLKRILEDMGFEARLVYGQLPEARCRALLTHALDKPATEFDIEPIAKLAAFTPEIRQRMLARARRDFAWLKGAVEPGYFNSDMAIVGTDHVRSHVWVQAKLDSSWQDLDTSFSDATIGDLFAEPVRFATEPKPDEYQRIEIRVVAETLRSGKLSESESLVAEISAASAASNRIYLTISQANPGIGNTLATKLGATNEFAPTLSVDGELTNGEPFPGIAPEKSDSAEFMFANDDKGELAGLYVDIKLLGTEGDSPPHRHALLDRVPSKLRLNGAVSESDLADVPEIEGIPSAFHAVHQIHVSNGGINPHQTANNIGLAIYFTYTYLGDSEKASELPLDSNMWPIAMFRQAPALVNERLTVGALNDRPDLRFYIGQPRVSLMSFGFEPGEQDKIIAWTINIVRDELKAVGSESLSSQDVAIRKIWYGVLQSAFETTQSEIQMLGMGAEEGLLSSSSQVEGDPVILGSMDDARLPAQPPLSMLQSLKSSELVILSEAALNTGARTWWTIGPDGSTRALLAPDMGGSKWFSTWNNYTRTNPYAKTKVYDVGDVDEWYRNKMKEINAKADKAYTKDGKHLAKTKKGGNLPKTRNPRGHTEYSIVHMVSWAVSTYMGAQTGLTIVAQVVGASMVIYAFL